jgi:hypothetical protein
MSDLINNHVLLDLGAGDRDQIEKLKSEFFGVVDPAEIPLDSIIYICGDLKTPDPPAQDTEFNLANYESSRIRIIADLSLNYTDTPGTYITSGQVPINIFGVGILFREFFPDKPYFDLVNTSHQFQHLTESNKGSHAYRTGIYLTQVTENATKTETYFKLLRCSTNLTGPTDNLREVDHEIVDLANTTQDFFTRPINLNHVLAQTYHNSSDGKQRKARISRHADKTKDMNPNGAFAFCTFYENSDKPGFGIPGVARSATDPYNYVYNKKTSVLTKLRFRPKAEVTGYERFDLTLYPNSLFIMPLSTNRLYTHEIVPSGLPVEKIPTRLGYVIRSSTTDAVFVSGKTFVIDSSGDRVELVPPTQSDVEALKHKYRQENKTTAILSYGDTFFSLNSGDYTCPIV